MASSVCCVVYASQPKLRVQSSLAMASTSDLTAAVALRTTPADVSQLIATALLPFVQQAAVDAALALRDARLDGHDTEILALQNAGPFATAGDLNTLQLTLQSAIDGILAEISTLGGATNLVNAPAWVGNVTWDLLAGTNQIIRNLHATGPLSIVRAGHSAVHGCCGGMVGQLQVHGGRRGFAVEFRLEGCRADWLALEARPWVRLVLTAVRPEPLAAMRPSAAARSLARA